MLSHYIKTAWRHLLKNKFVSLINISGLIVGMTTVLFIWQYVSHERSYDQFHENSERIVRVRTDRVNNGVPFMQFAAGTAGAGLLLKNNLPEIEDYVKLRKDGGEVYSTSEDHYIREDEVYFVMPSLFKIFSFPLVEGDPENVLSEPFTACVSASMAEKLFGEENPLGKTITQNGEDEYKITGIFADIPENSHIKFNILLSYITFSDVFNEGGVTETSTTWDGFFTYLLLKPGTDWQALEKKIPDVIEKVHGAEKNEHLELYLQPLEDIHLYSNYLFEAEVNGDGNAVSFLFLIGIIVLFIAWFNYINLATARSDIRAKEVGVRKVIGGDRKNLITQFLTEAAILNILAIAGSFSLAILLNPLFQNLTGKTFESGLFDPEILMAGFVILFLGTLLVSLYPAFLLSSFRPATTIQKNVRLSKNGFQNLFRRGLVTIQFIACIGLIGCTIIVFKQLNYMQNSDLGIDIDQVLVIRGPTVRDSTSASLSNAMEQEMKQLPEVIEVTGSSSVPGQSFGWTVGNVQRIGGTGAGNFHAMAAQPDYSEMLDMKLIAGRHMSDEMGTDQLVCLINETGMKQLEFTDPREAVGSVIEAFGGNRFRIVGVLEDFHQESPKSIIEPLIMRVQTSGWVSDYISVKLSVTGLDQTIHSLQNRWEAFFPGSPFEYFFLDDHFNRQYQADQRFARIFTLFSGLAIFVACLGLYALLNFIIEKRKKEISVRKILGASISQVMFLLTKEFLIMLFIALVVAAPLSNFIMENWLQDFSSRIQISWWIYGIAGVIALVISFLTVSAQGVKAATANPVKSLRNE